MRSALAIAALTLISLSPDTVAQTSPATVGGIVTSTVAPPIFGPNSTNCASPSQTWTYSVTALDASGGSSTAATGIATVSGCPISGGSMISATNYNLIQFTAASGAVTCNIFRTGPTGVGFSLGRLATVPCGANIPESYIDTGANALDSTTAPTIQSTGGIVAKGAVTALNFLAGGTSAGTSDWVSGGPLVLCTSTVPQPCIQPDSFFFQAYNGLTTAFGWTSPSSQNSVPSTIIVGAPSGGIASPLSFGLLTDTTLTSQPTLATVTGSLNANHLVSLTSPSTGNYDLMDAGIALTGSVIPYVNETIPTFDTTGTGLVTPAGNAV